MSLGIASLIFTMIMGHVAIVEVEMDLLIAHIKMAFMVFALLCAVGVAFSVASGNLKRGYISSVEPIRMKGP